MKVFQTATASLLGFSLLLASCATPPAPRPEGGPEPSAACLEWVVDALTSEKMKGSDAESKDREEMTIFLEQEFQALGLEPWRESYGQPLQTVSQIRLGTRNTLTISGIPGRVGSDFVPLSISSAGVFSGSLVFAGYGIRAESMGYDDYEGIDASGKVVLALRYEPGPSDPASPFDGDRPSAWSDLRAKAKWAHEAGAQALVLIDLPGEGKPERPLPLFRQRGPLLRAELPVLQVKGELLVHLLGRYGHDLKALRAAIDREIKPHSFALNTIKLSGEVDLAITEIQTDNVLGVLPGRDELADEVVVVAANVEHSVADDNASGVAATLCSAAGVVQHYKNSSAAHRSLMVATFSGGELGRAAADYYSLNPNFPLTKTVAMLNLYPSGAGQPPPLVNGLLIELLSHKNSPTDSSSTDSSLQVGDHRGSAGRAHLGTVPDLARISEQRGGVPIASTMPGSPAETVGLRSGDRIVQMGGIATPNINVFTRVLLDHSVGERTEITIRRGGQQLRLWVTLKARVGLIPLR